jgi:hypothetical protein
LLQADDDPGAPAQLIFLPIIKQAD